MSKEDVDAIHEAGRRAKALESILQRSIHSRARTSVLIAKRELEELRKDIYQKYEIRL